MSKSLKFKNFTEAVAVFDTLPWKEDGDGNTFVYDSKAEAYVPVKAGQYIVSVGDRFEVADEEPEKAKAVEVPKEAKAAAKQNPTPAVDAAPTVEHPMGAESTVSDMRE